MTARDRKRYGSRVVLLTPAQLAALRVADKGVPCTGAARYGTLMALWRRQYIDLDNRITARGRAALVEAAGS